MKIKHIFAIMLATISIVCFAQQDKNSYYYYGDKKIPLTVNPNKISVLVRETADFNESDWKNQLSQSGLQFNDNRYVDGYNLGIYKRGGTITSDRNLASLITGNATLSSNNPLVLPCYTDSLGDEIICSHRITVKLKSVTDSLLINNIVSTYKLQLIGKDKVIPEWYTLAITEETGKSPVEVANLIYESGNFKYAEPDFDMMKPAICYDPDILQQWGFYNQENENVDINLSSAWNYATGKDVKVAVIENHINYDHPDLKDNFTGSIQGDTLYLPTDSTEYAIKNHGTMVCSVLGARRNNNIFSCGVAPDCKILRTAIGRSFWFDLSMLIDRIEASMCKVINCSWGHVNNSAFEEKIERIIQRSYKGNGIIVCFSAGNFKDKAIDESVWEPQNEIADAFVVAGCDRNGNWWKNSCHGPEVDIAAPADDIYVLLYDNEANPNCDIDCGTSFAAPIVAGVAAMIYEINPDFSPREVMDIMEQTAQKLGDKPYATVEGRPNGTWNEYLGYGVVDALAAVKLAKQITEQRKSSFGGFN